MTNSSSTSWVLSITPLEADRAATSPMHRRVILAVSDGDPRAPEALRAELPGVALRQRGTGIFRLGVPRIVGNWMLGEGLGGLSALVAEQELLQACRALTDVPFQALAEQTGAPVVVELLGPEEIGLARRLYPDARIIDPDGLRSLVGGDRADVDAMVRHLGLAPPRGPLERGSSIASDPPPSSRSRDPRSGSPFEGRALFILGCARSGTTWLNGLLLSHPSMSGQATAESWVFRAVRDLWVNDDLAEWVDRRLLAASIRRFVDHIFAANRDATAPSATWFVEKSPVHVFHIPELAEVYPDAAYIHLLRDGRDVARSLVEVDLTEIDSIGACAEHWVEAVRAVQRSEGLLERIREVRYEELVADPVAGVSDLHRWLGLDVDTGTQARIAELSRRQVSRHGTVGPPGPGKWATLPVHDLDLLLSVAGPLLAELGYIERWPPHLVARLLRRIRALVRSGSFDHSTPWRRATLR